MIAGTGRGHETAAGSAWFTHFRPNPDTFLTNRVRWSASVTLKVSSIVDARYTMFLEPVDVIVRPLEDVENGLVAPGDERYQAAQREATTPLAPAALNHARPVNISTHLPINEEAL